MSFGPVAALHQTLAALRVAAQRPRLLVVSDFDGTLAGFSPDPDNVPVRAASLAALEQLAVLPDTRVVLLSGRERANLQRVSGVSEKIALVGSHGAEGDPLAPVQVAATAELSAPRLELLAAWGSEMEQYLATLPQAAGAFVETKPVHRVLHVRGVADPEFGAELLEWARTNGPTELYVTPGNCVMEFAAFKVTKGMWLAAEMERWQPDAVVVFGDDRGDEPAFEVLRPSQDLGLKVGPGDTAARWRLADLEAVTAALIELESARRAAVS